jgi:hypothetical protein
MIPLYQSWCPYIKSGILTPKVVSLLIDVDLVEVDNYSVVYIYEYQSQGIKFYLKINEC